jgi:hypothetical protein
VIRRLISDDALDWMIGAVAGLRGPVSSGNGMLIAAGSGGVHQAVVPPPRDGAGTSGALGARCAEGWSR